MWKDQKGKVFRSEIEAVSNYLFSNLTIIHRQIDNAFCSLSISYYFCGKLALLNYLISIFYVLRNIYCTSLAKLKIFVLLYIIQTYFAYVFYWASMGASKWILYSLASREGWNKNYLTINRVIGKVASFREQLKYVSMGSFLYRTDQPLLRFKKGLKKSSQTCSCFLLQCSSFVGLCVYVSQCDQIGRFFNVLGDTLS